MKQNHPEPCELAEIIFEKPLSGEFEEVLFSSDGKNTLWVKFSDKDGAGEWIGIFEVDYDGASHLEKLAEPDQFIISGGNSAYVIDATRRKLVSQHRIDKALEIIYDRVRKCFIAADYTDLTWVNLDGTELFCQTIAENGIRYLRIEGNLLKGWAYRYHGGEERQFFFDLEKKEILSWE